MAHEYATPAEAIARNPALANVDPIELNYALEAASRWIDSWCSRKFWLDETATTRVFKATDRYVLDLGAHEIGDDTGVIVATDEGGDGTFDTTVDAADYVLEPVNAPHSAQGPRPYTAIRAVGGSWPLTYGTYNRQDLVQVTARYGWPTVPAVIRDVSLAVAIVEIENPTGVRSEAIDGYSVSYSRDIIADTSGANAAIRARLAPYQRMWAL